MFHPELYHKALEFAAHVHLKQQMPGRELPYLLHLTQVCGEVIYALTLDHNNLNTDLAIQCALLHDTIEDTETTEEIVHSKFGEHVALGVKALTKNIALPKEEQMEDSLNRILDLTAEIRIVKMADRIVNLQEPPYYSEKGKETKISKRGRVNSQKLQGVHPFIESRLEEKIKNYSQYI